jgi:hypothetical protein
LIPLNSTAISAVHAMLLFAGYGLVEDKLFPLLVFRDDCQGAVANWRGCELVKNEIFGSIWSTFVLCLVMRYLRISHVYKGEGFMSKVRYKVHSVSASDGKIKRGVRADKVSAYLEEIGFEAKRKGTATRLNAIPVEGNNFELHFFPKEKRVEFVKVNQEGGALEAIDQGTFDGEPGSYASSLCFHVRGEENRLWTFHCNSKVLMNGHQ